MDKIKQFCIKNKKKIIWTFSLIGFFFLLLIFFTYGIYLKSPFLNKVRSFFHLPVAIVGSSWITFDEFDERIQVMENNYKNQDFAKVGVRIDFETEEGKKRLELEKKKVLDDMIEQEIINDLAREYGVRVTKEMVDMKVKRLIAETGDSSAKVKEIKDIWGLDLDDFERLVAYPAEIRESVDSYIGEENTTDEMKEKVALAKKELDDNRLFSDVAKKYSEGMTKDLGGALGWFKLGQLNKDINDVAFSLELNKYSDIIESRQGFHIIMITDKRELPGGEQMIYLNQIIIKKPSLVKKIEDKMEGTNIFVLVKDYNWKQVCISCEDEVCKSDCVDKNNCKICSFNLLFKDREMQEFEVRFYEEQF